MRHLNRPASLPFIAIIATLPFILFWRWLLKGEVLYWGTPLLQFWPWHHLARQSLLAGVWPLWNPWLGNGTPLLANLQTAVFYPPNLLYLLLPVEHGLTLSVILHLVMAGLLMYLYTRQMDLPPFAAALAGLTYMLSGYLVGRTQFVPMINAAAWLPLLLLLTEKVVTRPAGLTPVWLGLALAGQLLAGHAQLTFYSLWLIGAYALVRRWQVQRPPGRIGPALLKLLVQVGWRLGLALVLAGLLAAIQLLPTAEFVWQSPRGSGAERTFALTYSFWPWRLITLLAPNFFGHPARGDYWGYANYWEDHAYLGVLPFLLALIALWRFYGSGSPDQESPPAPALWQLTPFLAGLALVSLVLALGWNTPIYLWVFDHIPGFSFFQGPARLLIWYTAAMAILAGIGAHRFASSPAGQRGWRRLLVASAGVALAAAGGSLVLTGRSRTFLVSTFSLGMLLAASAFLLLQWPRNDSLNSRRGQRRQWLVMAFVVTDLLLAALPLIPTLPATIYHGPIASAEFLRTRPAGFRFFVDETFAYETNFYQYFRFNDFGPPDLTFWQGLKETLTPNLGIYASLPAANNYDPLVVGRWQHLIDLVKRVPPPQRDQLLALMNVGYFITAPAQANEAVLYEQDGLAIQALSRALPRAYFVPRAYPAGSEAEVIARLTAPDFDSRREVIIMPGNANQIDQLASLTSSPETADPNPGADTPLDVWPVVVQEQGPEQLSLTVEAPTPGFVVLTDTFYPGWQVTLDGQPGQVWPANLSFRAVAVEAGRHTLVFSYRPISFIVGLWVSTASLLAVIALIILYLYRKIS